MNTSWFPSDVDRHSSAMAAGTSNSELSSSLHKEEIKPRSDLFQRGSIFSNYLLCTDRNKPRAIACLRLQIVELF